MNWNRENTLRLIELIRERPVIWDATSLDPRNRIKKNEAFEEVAILLDVSVKDLRMKWTSLRYQYKRERLKMARLPPPRKSRWFAYHQIKSLMQATTPKKTYSHYYKEEPKSPHQMTPQSVPTSTACMSMPTTLPTMPILLPSTAPSAPMPTCAPPLLMRRPSPPRASPLIQMTNSSTEKKNNMKNYGNADSSNKVIRDQKQNSSSTLATHDVSTFGMYVLSILRQFSPRLQTRAKFEINKVLFRLEMEHIEQKSNDSIEAGRVSSLSDYPESPNQARMNYDIDNNSVEYIEHDNLLVEDEHEVTTDNTPYPVTMINISSTLPVQKSIDETKNDGLKSPTEQQSEDIKSTQSSLYILNNKVLASPK